MLIQYPLSKRRSWILLACLFSSIYLVFIGYLPSEIPYAPHDDSLFLQWATDISAGRWLGLKYDELTLAKGPFHSIIVALIHRIGINPAFGLRSLYLIAALWFSGFVLARAGNWIRSLSLLCLLFDPWMFFGTSFVLRLLREASYVPIQLLAIGAAIVALDQVLQAPRLEIKFWFSWIVSVICFGLLLITREARMAVVALSLEACFLLLFSIWRTRNKWRRSKFSLASIIFLLIIFCQLPTLAIAQINQYRYGMAITNEFEEGEFKKFYQDLISVRIPGDIEKPWVPLNQSAIQRMIDLKPNSVLGKSLSRLNPGWKQFGCDQHQETCGEYAGGWFMWAWRSAFFKANRVKSPENFQDLTKIAHKDLKKLCRRYPQSISCDRSAVGYLPLPHRWGHSQGAAVKYSQAIVDLSRTLLVPQLNLRVLAYQFPNEEWTRADQLGIRLPSKNDEMRLQQFWGVRNLFYFGFVCRLMMIVILFVQASRHLSSFLKGFFDSGVILISSGMFMHMTLLALIHITSFNAFAYLGLASPLLTGLVWRWIAVIQQDRRQNSDCLHA